MTGLGISTSRVFSVGNLPEIVQVTPNTTLATAMRLPMNSICNGAITDKSVDHYSFEAQRGARIIVDCAAKGIDSKMNAVLIVADAKGNDLMVQRRGGAIDFDVPEDGSYIVKVHELTFKGGPEYFYRLALTQVERGAVVNRLPATPATPDPPPNPTRSPGGSFGFSLPPHPINGSHRQVPSYRLARPRRPRQTDR